MIREKRQLSVATLTAAMGNQDAALEVLESQGVKLLHFDVMDGRIWPQITVGTPFVAGLETTLLKDVHLLIEEPEKQIPGFVKAGADLLSFSVEGTGDLAATLAIYEGYPELVRGVSLDPGTEVEVLADFMDRIDYVLLLGVGPTTGKESFLNRLPAKMAKLRAMKDDLLICVDGAVKKETIEEIAAMKPDFVVSGSAIFDGQDPVGNLEFFGKVLEA